MKLEKRATGYGHYGPATYLAGGYLLKLIRQSTGLSQEGLAELVGVDSNTVQGWETGRRSLTGTRVATLVELRHRLRPLGADPQLLGALEDAAEADYVLAYTLGTEPAAAEPSDHPLAGWVPKRSFAYLLPGPSQAGLRSRFVSQRHRPAAARSRQLPS